MPVSGTGDPIDEFLAPLTGAGQDALTVAVMVSSVDGRATIGGRVGELTGAFDQRVLLGLREHAAAVVIGAGTQRAEGYDRLLDDGARARRSAAGLPEEPELVVLSHSGAPLGETFSALRARHPTALIVSEGGPTALGSEVTAGLIDQLVLCISPRIVGDSSQKRIIELVAPLGLQLELLAHAVTGGFVFLRYGVK